MFKGREVKVGDTLWRSRAYGFSKPTEETLAIEYKVAEIYEEGFSANPQGLARKEYIDGSRRWDRESYYWDIEGKMKKFYSTICLLEQPFVMDGKKKVQDIVAETALAVRENVKVRGFSYRVLGEESVNG